MKPEQQVILIVDDNADNLELLGRYVRRLHYTVVTAVDGHAAINLLRNQPVDLLLLDIMMPDVSGYEVLAQLKADDLLRHIPVIVISALNEFDSVIRCIDLGAADYLTKPFNATLLRARINACLEKKRLHDQQQAYLEELQIIQRIDRELNASLDVDRAMALTLEWAIRRSGADAGLIGAVEADGIRIMASEGYSKDNPTEQPMLFSGDIPAVQAAIATGQPQRQHIPPHTYNHNGAGLIPAAVCQVVLPLRRENDVIGLIVLESHTERQCTDAIMAFLSRLSDHAAIAIANAQLYAAVQAANIAKSEFVSFSTHELKTPMTAIRGYTDILITGIAGAITDTQTEFLQAIRTNVDLMITLVSDLADISRIESGHLNLDPEALPVSTVVEAALHSTRTQIAANEQVLLLDVAADLPLVWGDRTRLTQVISNLVSNAYKYTPHGGEIHIHAEHVIDRPGTLHAREVVRLSVQDSGYGISLEDQPRIFGKFFRGGSQDIANIPGTGLGLHITRHLVELQGGRIWFTSTPGEGTTFCFTIPVAQATKNLPERMLELEV
jgi:signal transduction histidine kinase/response regulator of citrate/malate metabolism